MSKSVTSTNLPAKRSSHRRAKAPVAQLCNENRTIVQSISPIILAFKTNFPRKTALELALRTGESVSFCEKCLIGQRQPGAAMLSALLRSDIGRTVLTALMAGSDAAWWREFSRQLELAALARQQAELQRTAEANRERLMRALAGEGAAS